MSADTTSVKAESTTETVTDSNKQQPNVAQNTGGGGGNRGGFRRGGGGGPAFNKFGNRRANNAAPYKPDEKRRFRPQQTQNQSNMGGNMNSQSQDSRGEPNLVKQDRIIMEKLNEIAVPTLDLQPLDNSVKKFTSRARLYVGNLPPDITEAELTNLFKQYGEVSEMFLNKEKHFAFAKLDYPYNAEKAKNELMTKPIKGKFLKIRFAPNGTTIKVKNLDEFVTNELLYTAFSIFGDIDRCVVIVDDRGKPLGEGIIEFSRKVSALNAVRKCTESCFFLTSALRPCIVESYEANDNVDGHAEKFINKKNPEFFKRRGVGPRFALPDSFEHEYGMRWKNLHERYTQKMENIKKELNLDQDKLIAQMELARFEHETAMLREQLRAREMDMDRQKKEWEMKEQQADEARRMADQEMRQQEQEMQQRIMQQNEELRRRQEENKLFIQAQQLDNMLNHQEQNYEQMDEMYECKDGGDYERFDPPPMQHNMRGGFGGGQRGGFNRGGGGGGGGAGGRWIENRNNEFYKRRRY